MNKKQNGDYQNTKYAKGVTKFPKTKSPVLKNKYFHTLFSEEIL